MSLLSKIPAVLRRWPIVLAGLVLGALLGLALSKTSAPSYGADAKVLVTVAGKQDAADMSSASQYAASQMASYETVASSPLVLQPVVDHLHLGMSATDLAQHVVATNTTGSFVLDISVSDGDPQRAADIANSIAQEMGAAIHGLTPVDKDGVKPLDSKTITPAVADPGAPASARKRNVAGLALVGLVLGLALAFLLEALRPRAVTAPRRQRKSPPSAESGTTPKAMPDGSSER